MEAVKPVEPERVAVDTNVQEKAVAHPSLNEQQRRWFKRRQAIEPTIDHTKHDHRMDKCWFRGSDGDALHAVLCAAGFNIRWLLRALQRQRLAGSLKHVCLASITLCATWLVGLMAVLNGFLGAKAAQQRWSPHRPA